MAAPLLLSLGQEETTTTTAPSTPVQTIDAWTAQAHSEKLVLVLVALFGLGLLSGLLLGKR